MSSESPRISDTVLSQSLVHADESSPGGSTDRNEVLWLGTTLALFLALNVFIRSRYIPWGDEVQFADPAANLFYRLGFVSTEWSNQTNRTFWSGNAPLYPIFLYVVFRLFGFSQTVARSINYPMMVLAVWSLWAAVRRAGFLGQAKMRLLMVALVLTGYSCYTCYSNIRYDCLSLLECSLVFLTYTATSPSVRNSFLFVLGTAMLLTNLQLPQYMVVLALIVSFAFSLGFTLMWRLRFLWLGFAAGGVSLLLLYASNSGSLQGFFLTLRQQAGQPLRDKVTDLHYYFQYDASLGALFLLLLVSFAVVRTGFSSSARKPMIAGLLICIAIPAFFFLSRRFVFSSAWMVYVPAVVCVCWVLEAKINDSRLWKTFALICCASSMAFGLPKAVAGILNDWTIRNYAVLESFVAANVTDKDRAFCDPAAYFATKPRAVAVYGPGYPMSASEKQAITLIIVDPENEEKTTRDLGGRWVVVQTLTRDSRSSSERMLPFSSKFSCRLKVLRRPLIGSEWKRAIHS